jgi:hypothetical protein
VIDRGYPTQQTGWPGALHVWRWIGRSDRGHGLLLQAQEVVGQCGQVGIGQIAEGGH